MHGAVMTGFLMVFRRMLELLRARLIHEARFKRRLEGGGTALLPATHYRNHGTRTARCRSPSSPGLPPPMARPLLEVLPRRQQRR
jgi:hypothetical protein